MSSKLIMEIEENIKKFRLKKLDANGDFYEDDENYDYPEEVDENEEHRLCRNELI